MVLGAGIVAAARLLVPVRRPSIPAALPSGAGTLEAAGLQAEVLRRPSSPGPRIALIRQLVTERRLRDAVDAGREAMARFGANPFVAEAVAEALLAAGHPDEAARTLRPLVREPGALQVIYADCLARDGRPAEAVRFLERLGPLPYGVARRAAEVCLESLEPDAALRILGKTPLPRPLEIRVLQGNASLHAGKYGAAASLLGPCVREAPARTDLRFLLGSALRLAGNPGRRVADRRARPSRR